MKNAFLWAALLFPLSAELRADWVVVQKVEDSGQKQTGEITLKIKGEKIRVDLPPDISVLMDTDTGETFTLRHGQKTVLRVPAATAAQLGRRLEQWRETRRQAEPGQEPPKWEATGKGETVAGRETKIFVAQAGAMKVTWWIAQNSPEAEKFAAVAEQLQKAPMVQLAGGLALLPPGFKPPGLPVKTEIQTPDGRKISTTILAIKEQPLDAIDFTPPPDYRSLPEPFFGPSFFPQSP